MPPPVVSPLYERSPPLTAASSGSTAAYRVAASAGQDDALHHQLQWMQRNGGVKQNLFRHEFSLCVCGNKMLATNAA